MYGHHDQPCLLRQIRVTREYLALNFHGLLIQHEALNSDANKPLSLVLQFEQGVALEGVPVLIQPLG